jgi:hypothetical protein
MYLRIEHANNKIANWHREFHRTTDAICTKPTFLQFHAENGFDIFISEVGLSD